MKTHEAEMWEMIYNSLDSYLNIGEQSVRLWFGQMELRHLTENAAYFSIDNYNKQTIVLKTYYDGFKKAVKNVLGFEPKIHVICVERESFENQFAELVCGNDENPPIGTVKIEVPQEPVTEKPKKMKNKDVSIPNTPYNGITINSTRARGIGSKKRVFTFKNAPKRYNPENDTIETVPLSKYYEDMNSKSGVLIMSPSAPKFSLNYTFDNFVVGESNKCAFHYCTQVSHYPAKQYNPLFIYGNPGLGKTHLLYAITNEIERLYPSMNRVYIKGDDFTNELVNAISSKRTTYFHDKYRNTDILLMDDIQFIAGKPSTQEEFFHTYESLYQTGKQIIVTSDVKPKDIKNFEERLRSRFESGIIVSIDQPDTELRTAIFKSKAAAMGIYIPNDVLLFLAQSIKDNVRQIEGIIKKLYSISLLNNVAIDMELAQSCVTEIADLQVTINDKLILNAVSKLYEVEEDTLLGKNRTKRVAYPRNISIYLMRKLTQMSLNDIAAVFKRDHTTIMSSIDCITRKLEEMPETRKEIDDLIVIIRSKNN